MTKSLSVRQKILISALTVRKITTNLSGRFCFKKAPWLAFKIAEEKAKEMETIIKDAFKTYDESGLKY